MDEQKELIEAEKALEDATKRIDEILNQGDWEPKGTADFMTPLILLLSFLKPPTPFPGEDESNNWPGHMN